MKASIVSAFALLASSATAAVNLVNRQVPAKCNADNCARAVLGQDVQNPGPAQRTADCSSYFMVTVSTNAAGFPLTTFTPTSVPSYASACNNPLPTVSSRYSSACSCGGISAYKTTTVRATDTCIQDNCYRAVLGTAPAAGDLSTRLASCSAYQTTTIYTAGPTTVSTGTSSVPTFASACTPSGRFASACSCGGITAATVYAEETVPAKM